MLSTFGDEFQLHLFTFGSTKILFIEQSSRWCRFHLLLHTIHAFQLSVQIWHWQILDQNVNSSIYLTLCVYGQCKYSQSKYPTLKPWIDIDLSACLSKSNILNKYENLDCKHWFFYRNDRIVNFAQTKYFILNCGNVQLFLVIY